MKKQIYFIMTLASFFTVGCTNGIFSAATKDIPFPLPKLKENAKVFASCGDLALWQTQKAAMLNFQMDPTGGMMASASPIAAAATNIQEADVDEGDLAKSDDHRVYFARTRTVEIVSRDSMTLEQTLRYQDRTNLQILIDRDRLVVVGESDIAGTSIVSVYAISDRMKLVAEFKFAGRGVRARLIDSTVVLTAQLFYNFGKPLNDALGIPCGEIQEPVLDDLSTTVTTLHRLDLSREKLSLESHAILGSADQIYVTKKHLYVASYSYRWYSGDPRIASDVASTDSVVMRFNHSDWTFEGVAAVNGTMHNQFSFHELDDRLVVATTFGFGTAFGGNRLWTMGLKDSRFQLLERSELFAPHEEIRSARFIGERAYIVTFEKTDPLYTFDLSDPVNPILLSELKIPGFSSYLHPLNQNLLFGAGYAAVADAGFSWFQGVQLSLFRLLDDGRVDLFDQRVFGGRGGHVDVGDDHHAFARDFVSGRIFLPVRIMVDQPSTKAPWEYSNVLEFSGAYVIDPRAGVEPMGKISNRDLIPKDCVALNETSNFWSDVPPTMDIRRVMVLPEALVALSPFGARWFSRSPPFEVRRTLVFADSAVECERQRQRVIPRD